MNQRSLVNIILVVVALVIIVWTVYFVLVKKQASVVQYITTSTPSTNQVTQPPAPVTQTSNNETADWKIYRNKKYGFEVKYPFSWQVVDGGGLLDLEKRFLPTTNTNPEAMNGFCKLGFYAFDDKLKNETIKDWLYRIASENGNPAPTDLTSVAFGSRIGLHEVGGEIGLVNSVYLPLSDISVLSTSLLCGDDVLENGESEFNQILSTLKFTE